MGVVGFEVPFGAAKVKSLYRTHEIYVQRFNKRVDELVRQGWLLAEDVPAMRAEAVAQRF